jgi:hypothetical protein
LKSRSRSVTYVTSVTRLHFGYISVTPSRLSRVERSPVGSLSLLARRVCRRGGAGSVDLWRLVYCWNLDLGRLLPLRQFITLFRLHFRYASCLTVSRIDLSLSRGACVSSVAGVARPRGGMLRAGAAVRCLRVVVRRGAGLRARVTQVASASVDSMSRAVADRGRAGLWARWCEVRVRVWGGCARATQIASASDGSSSRTAADRGSE